jgi:hypothetical protein
VAESGVVSPVSVATKGMDVTTDLSVVWLWSDNQDPLDAWDGETLTTIASGLVSSYGTEGEALWAEAGVTFTGALMLGLTTAPLIDKDPVWLRRYDRDVTETATELTLSGAVYMDLGSDGVQYVSSSDFDQGTRRIIAVDRDLATQEITELPES